MSESLKEWLQTFTNFKFPGGVFGKTCTVVVAAIAAPVVMVYFVREPWFAFGCYVISIVFASVFMWKNFTFASDHPELAALEGAEFTHHHEMLLSAKNQNKIAITVQTDEGGTATVQPMLPVPPEDVAGETQNAG